MAAILSPQDSTPGDRKGFARRGRYRRPEFACRSRNAADTGRRKGDLREMPHENELCGPIIGNDEAFWKDRGSGPIGLGGSTGRVARSAGPERRRKEHRDFTSAGIAAT